MPFILLSLSIILSSGRNIFSKGLSGIRFGTRFFFVCQACLFIAGGAALFIFGNLTSFDIATETLILAVIYGALLILAQWFYTVALTSGNTALCSTVYSMGFILPTFSGALIWDEPFSVLDLFGILSAIAAVIISGLKQKSGEKRSVSYYFVPLVIAMLASGGLGIVQKVQQRSAYAEQKSLFLIIAFMLAAAISLIFACFAKCRTCGASFKGKRLLVASCVGLFFGCCNLLNTSLAGMLDSAIFFPTLNIGTILLSMLLGVIVYKEKIGKREALVLMLGAASIILLNFD